MTAEIEPRVNRAAVAIASGVSFLVGFVASSLTTMVMMLPTDVLWGLILSWCL